MFCVQPAGGSREAEAPSSPCGTAIEATNCCQVVKLAMKNLNTACPQKFMKTNSVLCAAGRGIQRGGGPVFALWHHHRSYQLNKLLPINHPPSSYVGTGFLFFCSSSFFFRKKKGQINSKWGHLYTKFI